MTYIIYTRKFPPCSYCDAAKNYMKHLNIDYEEWDIDGDGVKHLFVDNGWKSVPQILKVTKDEEIYIGGYRDLVEHLKGFKNVRE